MTKGLPKRAALIVAAGRGTRAGGALPKQWQPLGQVRVIDHAVAAFRDLVDVIMVVHHPDDLVLAQTLEKVDLVPGAARRSDSVKAGLTALNGQGVDQVLIHDAARALVPREVIQAVIAALDSGSGAAPALAVTDALWLGAKNESGTIVEGTQDRTGLFRAQTPQGFAFDAILHAHQAHSGEAADDVEVARKAGMDVTITQGSEDNFKITHPEDFARAERLLAAREAAHRAGQKETQGMEFRLGNGYDVHRFGEGNHVWLCGVKVPHGRSLQGHSDADVGMHALTDAIYGALAEGDIGQHFPPTDPQWKGAESHIFLRHAIKLARDKGYEMMNCDVTLVCERPKVGPHAQAMRRALAEIMDIAMDKVSVKATTSERLGFTGREEGIAALATAALMTQR
ncbi:MULTISPECIES: bifunctional 2-C-methyl-D-erythritol 4-phosphate cytidylyltransferase/2-C-methyl-D-erythritol 2,4-cyclodiphosphate synthase [Roseobacteraceae]|uniref:bifunctional 2-C-methyl-D-erythritol 4-phosphate cytidylyltransferase/2-C-methyl-D-erythritol 2,4-cyclodiphosphate synthase n=1 Tax=Roseobacteraceae TaxID=2854170 RepID=UPI00125F9031|nr:MULTISPECIES: bifunctional 2-C-methyl-D-erythritol 4-phosphate cytidylyltransferase/2-C-methyl-D-erythritol 2,4-cyclodiphosphate synthase [Roseobacteraceae]KAB6714879.1 bifunctional 2-C-methyl-D-erythritol 4-phosphate cytidylyltransferase/2-C-methyl-D-erythritol 2,4-cyclodiphosphate synthase [Roseobacter sp. TSBP12]